MGYPVTGLHHITACAGGAQQDIDFFTKVVGQRMIKQTILFDGRYAHYHFYYANGRAEPGTVMTTFPYNRVKGLPFALPSTVNTPTALIFEAEAGFEVNVTNQQPQTVQVGQQVALSGYSSIANPASQGWNVNGGTFVGGYKWTTDTFSPSGGCLVDANAANPNACVPQCVPVTVNLNCISVKADGPNFTIYFTPPTGLAGPATVTVTYVVSGPNGQLASASTQFSVVSPGVQPAGFAGLAAGLGNSGVTIQPISTNYFGIGYSNLYVPGFSFGFNAPGYGTSANSSTLPSPPNITQPPGLNLNGNGIPGTLGFVQVVSGQSITAYGQNGLPLTTRGVTQCLDILQSQIGPWPFYPFPQLGAWNFGYDSPDEALITTGGVQVFPNAAFAGAGGSYNTYLMYQPTPTPETPSIPVPLAVVPWNWNGGAHWDGQNWVLTGATAKASPSGSIPAALTNGVFPVWQTSCPYQQALP